jgi:hypothetical protein
VRRVTGCFRKKLAQNVAQSVSSHIWHITGANPTIASYNASVVKIYTAVNSMARF